MLLICIMAPTSFVAMVVWWREPRLWWASVGMMATAFGFVTYLPLRRALSTPREFDEFGYAAEFVVFGGWALIVHMGLLLAIGLLSIERIIEKKKAAIKTEDRQ